MFTRMPTRHRAATDSHSAYANSCLQSAPRNLQVYCSRPLHTASAPLNGPTQVPAIRFCAQSTASDHSKPHSIPILLPP